MMAHIVSQTRQNIEFLIAQNEISPLVGQRILSQLPTPSDVALRDLTEQTRRLTVPSPPPLSQSSTENDRSPRPPSVPPPRRISQPPSAVQRAKALWAYNEDGSESNDLSFRADWWTGKVNGRQGLFPSSYVEKVSRPVGPPSYPPPSETVAVAPTPSLVPYNSAPSAPYQPAYDGPPQGGYQPQPMPVYNQYMGPPGQPPPQQVMVQQAPPSQPPKSNRFGGLGQVLATSAVGGVGFGAGAAIGGGIVDAIF
ncbi:SH3-domain-containing protein [Russula earlei]|uniref:SH3-domain-containing protein n=1 Tax=Russula earlei TaxID=71964 RepID=A0ACC0UP05_9AGAM|nr:SH3-domain-containing protein [Russula earlei]